MQTFLLFASLFCEEIFIIGSLTVEIFVAANTSWFNTRTKVMANQEWKNETCYKVHPPGFWEWPWIGFSSLPDVSVNLPCEHNWKHFHCCAGGGWLAPSHPSVLLPGQFGLLGNLLQLKYLTKDIAQLPGWRQKHFNAGVFYPILFLQLPGSCRVLPPGSNVVWLVPGSVQAPALSSPHRHQALLPAGHCILDEWLSL